MVVMPGRPPPISVTSPAAPSATHSSSHPEIDRRLVVPVTTSMPSSPAASTIPRATSSVYGPDRSRKTTMIWRGVAGSRSHGRTYPYRASSSSTRSLVTAPTSRRRCTTLDTVLSETPASAAMLVSRPYCASCRPLPRPVTRCPFRTPNVDAPDRTACLAGNPAARQRGPVQGGKTGGRRLNGLWRARRGSRGRAARLRRRTGRRRSRQRRLSAAGLRMRGQSVEEAAPALPLELGVRRRVEPGVRRRVPC